MVREDWPSQVRLCKPLFLKDFGNMFRGIVLTVAIFAVSFFAGCPSDGPQMYPVSGKVTCNGKPLTEGYVLFSGSGPTANCPIKDGEYSGETTAGKKKVEIYSSWETGETQEVPDQDNPGETITEKVIETIPDKFNEKSELSVEIKEGDNSGVDFNLKTDDSAEEGENA